MYKKLLLLFLLIGYSLCSFAQNAQVKGKIIDLSENKVLPNANILLLRAADSVLVKSVRADQNGSFHLKNLPKGRFELLVTYPKMADFITYYNLSDSSNIDAKEIGMELKSKVIEEVVISAKREAMRIKGDTISFVADSFKVAAGANVQELLKRLPGVEIDADGTIKAQGETVNRVLVEGDEFFGDDPLMATKYLKASSVKEIEIYDQKSKNAELTGIEDGTKNKTINIKLKDDAKNGYIGNLDANSNLDNFKDYGGMLGVFKNKLKAAVFGNQANIGLSSQANRAFNSLKGSDYDNIEVGDDGSIMIMGFGGDGDYFNPQNGLPNNKTLGAHLSDKLKDNKISYKLNYKYTDRENTNLTTTNFQRLLPNQEVFITSGSADNLGSNRTNDMKGNVEIKVDSLSTLKVSFGFVDGNNNQNVNEVTKTINQNGLDISNNSQMNLGVGTSGAYNGNINYTKKFTKKGRSLAVDLQPEIRNSESSQNSINITNYYNNLGNLDRTENLNLLKTNTGEQQSIAGRINYSEPISEKISVLGSYSFKNIASESYKNSYDKTQLIGGKPKIIDSLSNNFDFNSISHVGKGVIQYRNPKFALNLGLEATQTSLKLQDLDKKTSFTRNYLNFGPNSNLTYKIARNYTFSANYTGSTRQPSLEQLQPIRELNNPLYQIVGNPLLKPSFNNYIYANFNGFSPAKEQYISIGLNYSFIDNEIVNTESIDENNKRTISYLNIDGNKTMGGSLYYDKGFSKLKLSISGNLSVSRSERTSVINNIFNKSISNFYNARLGLYYNPKGITFSYSISTDITTGRSTIGQLFAGNNITYNQDAYLTVDLPYEMQFTSRLAVTHRPSNAVFNDPLNIQQWDAALSAKAFKNKNLKLSLGVNDILDQRLGYNRSISGNTISESTYSYIPRYILLGINYNITGNFKSNSKQ